MVENDTNNLEEETPMVTQVIDEDDNNNNDENIISGSGRNMHVPPQLLYPLQPPVSSISAFKTIPAVHMGYAFTWFGLSGAGLYMTRKLITKGRY